MASVIVTIDTNGNNDAIPSSPKDIQPHTTTTVDILSGKSPTSGGGQPATNIISNEGAGGGSGPDGEPVSTNSLPPINNDMVVVYDNDLDDIEEFIFFESRLLSGLTRFCKLFVMIFPALIILLLIIGRAESEDAGHGTGNGGSSNLAEKLFEGGAILCVGLTFAATYYVCKFGICKGRALVAHYTGGGGERHRHREELKLQIRDPWRRKQVPPAKKPYFNHVEVYKESGLYKSGSIKY